MSFFDKLKAELIDIIEWLDDSNDTLIHRFERYGNEIKNGAQLIVRESQIAVFVYEGQIGDIFKPGRYQLTTNNIPILTTLKGWKYGFNSPFKCEVYFASTRNFTDRKWGTKNPIMMRDPEFGPIRLRAFGNYAMKLEDPATFIRQIAGTDASFTTDEITEQLKNVILTRFSDALAESKIPAIDMATQYDELSKLIEDKVQDEFKEYGLKLTKFLVENISFPPEVEEAIDKRSSMGVIGNLNNYMQYQAANSLEKAAENPGGTAGEGIGLGMGFAMANQMAGMFGQQKQGQTNFAPQQNPPAAAPPPIPGSVPYYVAVMGKQEGPYHQNILKNMIMQGKFNKDTLVWRQGMSKWEKAGDVADLVALLGQVPPPVPQL